MPENNFRAVIDLGTNTFHLLIAEVSGAQIKEVFRERRYVKLAEDGIGLIGPAPFGRAIQTLTDFAGIIKEHKCKDVLAFGTAALRTASNGHDLIMAAQMISGLAITIIPGDEEARLITKGVLAAIPPQAGRVLIMDIGGGSTEYIIADSEQVYFQQSFPIGVSVLKNGFHSADPISLLEKENLATHLREMTAPLALALAKYPTHHLVGAAGTFDVLAKILADKDAPAHPTSHVLKLDRLAAIQDEITSSTLSERLNMEDVPEQRADMIVVAMLLLKFSIKLAGITHITVSDWAMKEGILLDKPSKP